MSKSRFGGFSLPTTGSSGGLLDPIILETQQTVNYAAASTSVKLTESFSKLTSNGVTESFSKVSGKVGISTSGGALSVVDPLTGSQYSLGQLSADRTLTSNLASRDAPTTEALKARIVDQQTGNALVFRVMPTIDESHGAEYTEFNPVHHPGAIIKYRRTTARTWRISGKLIARNPTEAEENLTLINVIRSWVMPQYGVRTGIDNPNLGAPPPILTFSAYGDRVIGPVKCVLESFSWQFGNDVDYLPTQDINAKEIGQQYPFGQAPFPAILDVNLNLKESWAPSEFSNFDLSAYVRGDLHGSSTSAFYYEKQRQQPRTSAAPQAPTAMDRFVSGTNAARRADRAEPAAVTAVQATTSSAAGLYTDSYGITSDSEMYRGD